MRLGRRFMIATGATSLITASSSIMSPGISTCSSCTPTDITYAPEDRGISAESFSYYMHQHRTWNGTARPDRLRHFNRQLLEGADSPQHRQAPLRGYADLSRNRAGDRRLSAPERADWQFYPRGNFTANLT